jgi:acyl-CoA synthetase (NDP forming)
MVKSVIEEIDALFTPKRIAAFGVSATAGKLGNLLLQSFIDIGFQGELIPIHPTAPEIMGLKAYPNLEAYPNSIDLAIISLHPSKVFDAIKDCVEKHAKGIIIFSSGFSEQGSEGKKLEDEIVQYARSRGTRLIGPNCMGLYSPATKVSFFPGLPSDPGEIGFISQSGSLSVNLAFDAALKGIHFSKMISCGNSADLDLTDFLEYLGSDPATKVITCYIEGIKDGQRFLKVAREVSKTKPIIIWKVGETAGGKRAAHSHTGSIGGDPEVWNKIMDQAGILRVQNLTELIEHIAAFSHPYLPKGNRVVILSGPGGPAVSSADASERGKLVLASLTEETQQALSKILPEYGTSVANPVDLSLTSALNPALHHQAGEIVGRDPNVDMLLFFISVLPKSVIKGLLKIQEQIKKPIAIICPIDLMTSWDGPIANHVKAMFDPIDPKRATEYLQKLNESSISVYLTEQSAVKALAALWKYQQYLQQI